MAKKSRKGTYYWTTYDEAYAWAAENGWPTDRILEYGLGWAIQAGCGGKYAGPLTQEDSPDLHWRGYAHWKNAQGK